MAVPTLAELVQASYTGDSGGFVPTRLHVPTTQTISDTPKGDTQIPSLSHTDAVGNETNKKLTKQEAEELKRTEKEYRDSLAYIKDIIAPSMIKIDATKLQVGDTFVRTVFTYAYPDVLEGNWLSPLINWDVKFDISMFVYPVDSARVMKFLRTRLTQLRSQALINREK